MKFLFPAFLLCTLATSAQKIMLLDTRFQKPLTYTDSFTTDDIFARLFPLYQQDKDSVVLYANRVAHYMDQKHPTETETDTIMIGKTLLVNRIEIVNRRAFYSLSMKTQIENANVFMDIVPRTDDKRSAQRSLLRFSDYLTER